MRPHSIAIGILMPLVVSLLISCDKEDEATITTLTIASGKGRFDGAEWFYLKEKGSPGRMNWAYIAGFDDYEKGYEYK